MTLASPVAVRRKLDGVISRGEWNRQGTSDAIGQMIARNSCKIQNGRMALFSLVGPRPSQQIPSSSLAHERKHQIASGIHVVAHDQQFAKSRLPQVVREQLRI